MKRAWEETWNLGGGIWWEAWPPEFPTDEQYAHNAERMRLAEKAPEMYRLLDEAVKMRAAPGTVMHAAWERRVIELLKRVRGE